MAVSRQGKMKAMRKELRSGEDEVEEMMSRLQELPRDIVAHILSRLDWKTLSNCRRICKEWYQIISDPWFIDLRRQFMLKNSNLLFIDYWVEEKGAGDSMKTRGVWTFTLCDRNLMDIEGRICEGDFIIRSTRLGRHYYAQLLSANCDLLCLMYGSDVHLVNPTTGEFHILPGYPGFITSIMTCGYVASKREYIVVAMAARVNLDQSINVHERSRPVKLCLSGSSISSSTISSTSWKVIEADFPRIIQSTKEILINNYVYWPIHKGNATSQGKEIIVSLDLDKDTFEIIGSPPIPTQELHGPFFDYSDKIELIDFKGSLCLVDSLHMGNTNELILWALISNNSGSGSGSDSDSDSDSCWIKKYHIKLDFSVPNPRFCNTYIFPKSSREGELIMRSAYDSVEPISDGKYYVYNPETKRVKIVMHPDPTLMVRHVQQPFAKIQHTSHQGGRFFC